MEEEKIIIYKLRLGMKLLVIFLVALLFSGCYENLDPDSPCMHNAWVTAPNDVNSAWVTLTCNVPVWHDSAPLSRLIS